MRKPDPERIARELWRHSTVEEERAIYAIVDGARDEQVYPAVLGSDCEYCCLYRGEIPEDLAAVAPYLVLLEEENQFTTRLLTQGWGESWGIFLESAATLNDLRRHFRRFLMVYDEAGKPMYFRYYDPRVLRVYLPTCNADELQTVFGPVVRYCVESEDGSGMLEYDFTGNALTQGSIALSPAGNGA